MSWMLNKPRQSSSKSSTGPEEPQGNPGPLSLAEGLELSLDAGKNVDGHWALYYAFLFGLVGWISSNISTIGYSEALIISIASGAFFTLNAIATVRAYVLLSLIISETSEVAHHSRFASKQVARFVASKRANMRLPLRVPITFLAHIAGAWAVIYLAWEATGKR